VLLCASLNSAPLKMPTMTGTNNYFPFYRWYRIVSLSDVSVTSRYVTLAGPDWPAGTTVAGAQMVLMRGVVGVYSDVLELEGDGLWNR